MSSLPRRFRAFRRQLEIVLLELLSGMLRARWRALGVAVALIAVGLGALALPRVAARPAAARTRPAAGPSVVPEPTVPTAGPLSAAAFTSAGRRAPATAPLQRLPQVDLNGLSVAGIPPAALAAYVTAARTTARTAPGCHLRWWLLAGIGLVESGHARSGGSAGSSWNGIAHPPIYGPRLDGTHGFAAIHDTDRGRIDRDSAWDRAVGPLQFLPATWRAWGGSDRHGRLRDPQDIRAAALAAAGYLCAGGADLSQPQGMASAVYSYNHSFDYVRLVLSVAAKYAGLSPDALGVNNLPHDKPAKNKHKSAGAGAAASSPTGPGRTSASASPSSSPSSQPAPSTTAPSPTSSGPSIPPLPTPTSVVH